MKRLFILMLLLSGSVSAQTVINGNQVYVPGASLSIQVANDTNTGTVVNQIAKLTGTGKAIRTSTTDTTGFIGIVKYGAGTSGNASVVQVGQTVCVFDGATTANDYVTNSTTVNGDCHDAGSTLPSSPNIGRVLSTNGSGGTYTVLVSSGGGGGSGGVGSPVTSVQYNLNGSPAGAAGITTPDGSDLIVRGPIPYRDFTSYMRDPVTNAQINCSSTNSGDPPATGTISSSSHTLAVSAAADFKNGCGIAVIGAGPTATLAMPSTTTGGTTTRSGTLVTFTVTAGDPHLVPGIGNGQDFAGFVSVSGCSDSNFNTTGTGWLLNFGTPVTSFTYNTTGSSGTSATGCVATFYTGYAHGTTGSITYNYKVAPIDNKGGVGAAIGPIVITNGVGISASGSATDNFTRANGGLGANWTTVPGSTSPTITSNKVQGNTSGTHQQAYYSGTSFAGDMTATVTFGGTSTASDPGAAVLAILSDGSTGEYMCQAYQGAINLFTSGFSPLALGTATLVNGDTLSIRQSNHTYECLKNGASIGTGVKALNNTYTVTNPGLAVFGNTSNSVITNFAASTADQAALSSYNYNWIGWNATAGAREFAVYRSVGTAPYTCANISYSTGFSDWGLDLPNGCPSYVPSTPPSAPTSETLNTIITAGGGTTSLTLSAAASNTATSQNTYDDVTSFLTSCINDVITDQTVAGKILGSFGCLVPYGRWPFNADMPTDTVAAGSPGVNIQVEGTPVFQTWPWMVGSSYVIKGSGQSGGNFNGLNFSTTFIENGTHSPAGIIMRGTNMEFDNFNIYNTYGTAMEITSNPANSSVTAGIQINNVSLNINHDQGVGVPMLIDGNTLFMWANNVNFNPRPDGFPASIYFTETGYAGNGHADIFFCNIYTQWHHIVVDSPGGQNGGQGTGFTQNCSWTSEEHGQYPTGGVVALDTGAPNLPIGAPSTAARLSGGGIHAFQSADSSDKHLVSILGSQSASLTFQIDQSDNFDATPECQQGSLVCANGNVVLAIQANSQLIPGAQDAPFVGPVGPYLIRYPVVFGQGYTQSGPDWANEIPAPRNLFLNGSVGSGSLTAGTYCFVIVGLDSQVTTGYTGLSPEFCQTVGASSSIPLKWQLLPTRGNFLPSFNVYFGAAGAENHYFNQAAASSTDQTFSFTTTSGASSGTPPTKGLLGTAYSSWITDNAVSCLLCVPTNAPNHQLGIGEPNPPAGDEVAVNGGFLDARAGLKATTAAISVDLQLTETTVPSGISSTDVFWADSTAHWPKFIPNAGSTFYVVGTDGSGVSGHCAQFTDLHTLIDAGSGCGSGGTGTVTSFSVAADPIPIFTTSVANAGTTPALSFSLSTATANKVFANCTGSTATPGYQSLTEGCLPATTVFTDQNATFGAHVYDFSAATSLSMKVGAAYAPTVAGQFGINSTSHLPVFGFNGVSTITIPTTESAVSHNYLISYTQTTGAFTQGQPILNDIAAGTAPAGLYDFSGGTFKLPVAAGFVTTANGNIGYDTTNKNWNIWQNAANKLMGIWSATPINGQCVTATVTASVVNLTGAGCSGATLQTDTVNNLSQTLLNFTDTSGASGILFSNPSGGIESATLANVAGGGNSTLQGTLTGFTQGNYLCADATPKIVNCTPAVIPNEQVGTTYTILSTDVLKFLTFTNSSAVAVTVPTSFSNGFSFAARNNGAGAVTFTPGSGTILGGSTLVLLTGMQANLVFDGTNYVGTISGYTSGTTGAISGVVSASCDTGTVTINGATASMSAVASAATPGAPGAFSVSAQVSSSNTVTVSVCGTGTPTSSTYNVRLLP